jgi:hypothetical protein
MQPSSNRFRRQRSAAMKRVAAWVFYAVGALAIGYLALYAHALFTGRQLQPGDPIHIFRKPDAPNYSAATGWRPRPS